MIAKQILYFDQLIILACDAKCEKAWGYTARPRRMIGDDPDAYEFLSDNELGPAPLDPGTREGHDGKPMNSSGRLNKWCARQCERSTLAVPNTDFTLPDFSMRSRTRSKIAVTAI